jgi:hypothetical protein
MDEGSLDFKTRAFLLRVKDSEEDCIQFICLFIRTFILFYYYFFYFEILFLHMYLLYVLFFNVHHIFFILNHIRTDQRVGKKNLENFIHN